MYVREPSGARRQGVCEYLELPDHATLPIEVLFETQDGVQATFARLSLPDGVAVFAADSGKLLNKIPRTGELALVTEPYGAGLFVVDGVTIGLCREIAPILVAILVAGRSGAAFTAELASMNLREEVDAIAVLGLSPFQVLVLPRLLALTVALPLLIFVGDVAGIFGSMVLARPQLDLSYATYIERTATALTPRQVIIGLAKAPLFAAAIAVIACHMGLAAPREARAVGISTTSTVVQSIVAVILIDAASAILFAKLGW